MSGKNYFMTYRLINRLLTVIGVIVVGVISVAHVQGWGNCGWRALVGKDCILCGCTRDFFRILQLDFHLINPLSPYLFLVLLFELVFRSVGSFVLLPKRVGVADACIHGILVACFICANIVVMFR